MNNTILKIKENECTGCSACYNCCPVHAITMEENSEGFLFPKIDSQKCIDCGLCLRTCPLSGTKQQNSENPTCYAAWATDEIRMESSSGGIFSVLAENIFQKNGYVCGAAYSQDFKKVEHILISDRAELSKLRGSKYVQSDLTDIFSKIKHLLEEDKYVLFSGCPCQVAGLYGFLNKTYEKLFTVDLVCHGVPSPKAFRKFIEQRECENGAIQRLSFRDKYKFGWNPSTLIEFKNNNMYERKRMDSSWMKAFLNLLSLRKSCGQCPFARIPRQGDLTLADFWDIGKYNAKFDDGKGTSLLLVNNEHGKDILHEVKSNLLLCKEASLDFAKKHNAQLHSSSILHSRRKRFFELLDLYDFDKAVDYGINRRFDIGYVGWWYGLNYGSALTNYALHEVLVSMRKTVLMLEWPYKTKPTGSIPDNHTRRFANRHYETSMRYTYDQLESLNYHCDSFVLGSDQLWNYYSVQENGNYFFLDFVHPEKRKIAYATSFGHSRSFFPKERHSEISKYLSQFDAISVREKDGITICQNIFGVHAVQNLDPVFLCDISAYNKAIEDADVKEENPYILAYILNPTKEKRKALLTASKEFHLPLKVILDGQDNYEENKSIINLENAVLENIGVEDWLYYFKNAQAIITDSYHGLCFSIIFHKNFVCFGNQKRGMSRFETLMDITKLHDRLLINTSSQKVLSLLHQQIDYKEIDERLLPEKKRSWNWLNDALNLRLVKQETFSGLVLEKFDIIEKKLAELEKNSSKSVSPSMRTPEKAASNKKSLLKRVWKKLKF